MFLDKEYSSKVFQPLLAVPHFSKVAVAEVFCKKGVLENLGNHRCFSVNFTRFSRTPFSYNTSGAASEKLKAEAAVRRCSLKTVFLEVLLNSQEKTCARVSYLHP